MSSPPLSLVSAPFAYVLCPHLFLQALIVHEPQNAFTEKVVRLMSSLNTRPIIFPLSNPVSLCEVDYEDAIKW